MKGNSLASVLTRIYCCTCQLIDRRVILYVRQEQDRCTHLEVLKYNIVTLFNIF